VSEPQSPEELRRLAKGLLAMRQAKKPSKPAPRLPASITPAMTLKPVEHDGCQSWGDRPALVYSVVRRSDDVSQRKNIVTLPWLSILRHELRGDPAPQPYRFELVSRPARKRLKVPEDNHRGAYVR
jgi:hypothetical protein